ncbi:MAG: hypothetical protein ACRD3J_30545 [Thermoanaerobaculia bacterium]
MPEHAHYSDDEIVNPETRHEESDVNVRGLLWAVVIFIVFAALTHLILYLQFHAYARYFRNETTQPMTMMARPSSVPATPRLQPLESTALPPNASTPVKDMEEMRAAEEQSLNKAGWIDQKKGVVRLPIDVAKKLVVQRGLPVVKP